MQPIKNALSATMVFHRCRPLFKDEKNVWLRFVERAGDDTLRFHLSRNDQPGRVWTVVIEEVAVQRAVIGDPARQAFVLALCKAATKAKPVTGEVKLAAGF